MTTLRNSNFRFLVAALATFVVLEGVARIAGATMAEPLRFYDAETEVKAAQIKTLDEVDVLVVGSSMPWQGFLPASFSEEGLRTYNASLAGGVPPITERWLDDQDLIDDLQPETVVWGLSSLDFAPAYGQENFDRYAESLESAPGLLNDIERFTADYLTLVSHRTQLRDPSFLFGSGDDGIAANRAIAQNEVFPLGDRSEYEANTSPELAGVQRARLTDFEISSSDSSIIEDTASRLVEQGVRVVLIEMPVPQRFINLHPDGASSYELVHEEIERISSATGAEVIDASDWFDDDAFVDFTHLNRASAEVLTDVVASYLTTGELDPPARSTTNDAVADIPAAVPLASCETRFVEDEYGIVTEVLVCPDGQIPDEIDLEDEGTIIVRDADAQVVQGSDGWLFLPRSVEQVCRAAGARDRWIEEVEIARRILESVDKDLVVSIVPDRGVVATEFLGDIDNACQLSNLELIETMAASHPSIISLASVIDSSDLVRQDDTHWTSAGALAGSRLIVDALDPNAWQDDRIIGTDTFSHLGGLARTLGEIEPDELEFPVVDLSSSETSVSRTSGWALRTTITPGASDREIMLIHDSNGGNGSIDDEIPLGAYYVTPWFSRASSLRTLGGEQQTLWEQPANASFLEADAIAFMLVQRNVTAWLSPGRLSVNLIGAIAETGEIGEPLQNTTSLPAQVGDGVLVLSSVASPEAIEVNPTTGETGHRVDGSDSLAIYVAADTTLEFSEAVSGVFVPLDQYR